MTPDESPAQASAEAEAMTPASELADWMERRVYPGQPCQVVLMGEDVLLAISALRLLAQQQSAPAVAEAEENRELRQLVADLCDALEYEMQQPPSMYAVNARMVLKRARLALAPADAEAGRSR